MLPPLLQPCNAAYLKTYIYIYHKSVSYKGPVALRLRCCACTVQHPARRRPEMFAVYSPIH